MLVFFLLTTPTHSDSSSSVDCGKQVLHDSSVPFKAAKVVEMEGNILKIAVFLVGIILSLVFNEKLE